MQKTTYSLLWIYWNPGDQPFTFNINEFQYKRNLKHSTILHALFTWNIDPDCRTEMHLSLSIYYHVSNFTMFEWWLDFINSFKGFYLKKISQFCLFQLICFMLHWLSMSDSISCRPTKILSSTLSSHCM
jgi:hypothetical protein